MMNLTTVQALQRGVAAHKAGNLHEAEQFYRTVLLSKSRYLNTAQDIVDFPGFARHQIALKCNSMRGVYERQTVYRGIQERSG